jgi:ketosteroid isomerase-like protein
VSDENVESVRSLWRAFRRGGIEAVLGIAAPDVEWVPFGAGGEVLRGHDALRDYMERRRATGNESIVEPISFSDLGEHVLVYGRYTAAGSEPQPVFWLYTFHDGALVRFEAFDQQAKALDAARRAMTSR